MRANEIVRQCHRWLGMLLFLIVVGIFIVQGMGRHVAQWVYYVPLGPLALMMLSGAYMFFVPYFVRRRP